MGLAATAVTVMPLLFLFKENNVKLLLVNDLTDTVVNVVKVDPDNLPTAPDGFRYEENAGNIGDVLTDGEWITPTPDPAEALAAERAAMKCSRLQGRLVLGEATCDAIDAIAVDDLTPWAMRQTILNAIEWNRTSQAMTELGFLLGYTDTQMDDLFRLAMTVDV